ncbi:MAG: hypothetical protein EXS08_14225 [Planctomycetes bacterium]|nr:hypothetical protein [Planctomycetota bacterium]
MIISVINHTHGKLKDEDVQEALRAINRQIAEDFEPYWSLGARLRLEGKSGTQPTTQTLPDMRGDAVLYLWDGADVENAIGYHTANNDGVPFGFVFTDIAASLGEPWSVTLSHEALELIGDPETNLLAMGPHPAEPGRIVFHWFEMCDAVQTETYAIDGVDVSNFVLPLYFTTSNEVGSRNDFLGRIHGGKTLSSFGINPGGYVGFWDPELNDWATFANKNKAALRRLELKQQMKQARRSVQYQCFGARQAALRATGRREAVALREREIVPAKRAVPARRRGKSAKAKARK